MHTWHEAYHTLSLYILYNGDAQHHWMVSLL